MWQFFFTTEFWFLLLVAVFIFRSMGARRMTPPPRPWSWPVIGNLHHVASAKVPLYRWCRDRASEIASPVITINLGLADAVIINDVDHAYEAFMEKAAYFSGRPRSKPFGIATHDYSDVAFSDEEHSNFKPRRKLLATALKNFTVGTAYERRVEETLSKLVRLFDKFADESTPFDPTDYCKLVSFNLAVAMCFQTDYDFDDQNFIELKQCFREFTETLFESPISISDLIPFDLPFDLWDIRAVKRCMETLENVIKKHIANSRARLEKTGDMGDLTAYVYKTRDEGEKQGMSEVTDIQIQCLVTNIFGAGVDTTQMTLRWVFLYLALYPDIQEKVYQEIVDNAKDVDGLLISCLEYKSKMPYCEAVVLESTRCGTVAPLGLPHRVTADTKLGKYDIKKDTLVFTNVWAIHYDERNFEEPEEFRPERFLDETGVGPRPRGYLPFGLGRRACPGETAARNSVWMVMVALVRRYRFLPPEGVTLTTEFHPFFMEGTPVPYKILLARRT